MKKIIYLVECQGYTQISWFGSLEQAQAYCKKYAPDYYSIHKFECVEQVEERKPQHLYKKFW